MKTLILTMACMWTYASIGATIQFEKADSDVATTNGIEWSSYKGSCLAACFHEPHAQWVDPIYISGAVSFAQATNTTPLALFSPTGAVRQVFVVFDVATNKFPAVLLEHSSSDALYATNSFENPNLIYWESPRHNSLILTDGGDSLSFQADGLHVADITFTNSVDLSQLYIGAHPATPRWQRNWPGAVYEVVLFSEELDDSERIIVMGYLKRKWKLPLDIADVSSGDSCRILQLDNCGMYTTVLLTK